MVCEKCEKKLDKLATPDVWKKGARNVIGGKDGGIKLNMNVKLAKKTQKFTAYARKCRICKTSIPTYANYCQHCSYQKGICSMCGKKIFNTKMYKMSSV